MKKLTRVKLINWHRFQNDIIPFDDSVLLSGENGAGKSTILDAIQFVITCSKNHFNKAAHEKGKRNLNSYIRCKTGREDHPYDRTGEVTAHIALEFFDEARNQFFIVGAVMDSAAEEKEPNAAWYLMDNVQLQETLFFRGLVPKNISVFRTTNKKIRNFVMTQGEARKMMKARFGRLEDKFFSLIPKAMAFKPIHDIKEFVYTYVLDEKKVSIDLLKENVRSYQDLQGMLESVKRRIGRLEVILEKEEAVKSCIRKDRTYDYYLARAASDLTQEAIDAQERKIRKVQLDMDEMKSLQNSRVAARRAKQETMDALALELNQDESYRALHDLEKQEIFLKDALKQDENEKKELLKSVKKALKQAEALLEVKDIEFRLQDYRDLLLTIEQCSSLADVIMCINEVAEYKKQMYRKVQEKLAETRIYLRNKRQDLQELNQKISDLEKKKLTYPSAVMLLRDKIKEQFEKARRTVEPRILCELLQITNPEWQNAVEGYLNTQRFYILVEPEDFDLALSVYDRLREDGKVYGAGIINTGKLEEYDEAPKGSLAEVVTSKSIWAKRYINMTLGKVHMCKRYGELKQYATAITKQCMKYQNHVVSAIRPELYETPYIGGEAYKVQLAKCLEQRKQLHGQIQMEEERRRQLEFVMDPLDTACDIDIKYRLGVLEKIRNHTEQLSVCRDEIKRLKKNSTFLQKQIRLQEMQEEARAIDEKIREIDRKIGSCESTIQMTQELLERLAEEKKEKTATLTDSILHLQEELTVCGREYERQVGERSLNKFKENFERTKKANQTLREKHEAEMTEKMREYKREHDFGAPDSMAGIQEFRAEYDKLVGSELLSYEEKVYKAKAAAEAEFREQFLSRLQENIKQAQGEFKELNRALQDIHFSREQYEFRYEPGKHLIKYYRMIMDDFNVMQGASIFSGSFQENHREVIEELFEKLTLEDENSGKTLEEFTDYRTYMDYDIKITGEDGSYMLYSKVSQEKSGGETQTPFYITVAASFMQLYRNSIGGDAIGLVMFDEAFNNMDDERIAGVLEFLTQGNLQVIIAAPPDKIQYIGPSMKKTLLVLQDNETSFVEEFGHEAI